MLKLALAPVQYTARPADLHERQGVLRTCERLSSGWLVGGRGA